jgi:hypothetical protein
MKPPVLRLLTWAFGIAMVLAGAPVLAHHAFTAEFDAKKPVTIRGFVTKVEWTNPHVWVYLDVKDEAGAWKNWGFEMGAPHQLQTRGWSRELLKIGDELVVEGSMAKSGPGRMSGRNVTFAATGKKLGAVSSEGQTSAPATP